LRNKKQSVSSPNRGNRFFLFRENGRDWNRTEVHKIVWNDFERLSVAKTALKGCSAGRLSYIRSPLTVLTSR